ncbi:transposase [Candidatus Methylobacter oryzae]|uniref:Transposase n=1 Tax=Candidatus Methylobacter oryzae TaxID=2497749 RepID=A0ABY3CBC7_9GAMM|nr:transposase [Candidatus Methylobacter oryzae]
MEHVSHDVVSNFLKQIRITARQVWELVKGLIHNTEGSFLIIDDSVQDKRYSKSIELVKTQYSGAVGGLVRGIGVVNLVHSDGQDHYPVDYRIYHNVVDGKTKNDHFKDMLVNAIADKALKAKTVLFDSWYASWENLKLVHSLKRTFYTTLKSNRMISLSKEEGYVHLDEIEWTPERLRFGVVVKLKKVPFKVKLFKLVAPNGDIDWLITNELDDNLTAQVAQHANDVRWQVEEFHRELKQLTGSEKCQCRKARSQRNHIACCYHVWISLKVKANTLKKSLYQVRADLFSDYLQAELRHPRIKAYSGG